MKIEIDVQTADDAELAADVFTYIAGRMGGYDPETGEVTGQAAGTTAPTATGRGGRRGGGRKANAEKDRLAATAGESALKPGAALAGESATSLADALKGAQVVTEQGGVTVHTTAGATTEQVADMKAKLEGTGTPTPTTTTTPTGGSLGDIFAQSGGAPGGATGGATTGTTTSGQSTTAADMGSIFGTGGGAAGGGLSIAGGTDVSGGAGGGDNLASLFGKPADAPQASPYDTMSKEDLDKAIYEYVNTTGGMPWGRAALTSLGLRTFNDLTADQIRMLLKDPAQVKIG